LAPAADSRQSTAEYISGPIRTI